MVDEDGILLESFLLNGGPESKFSNNSVVDESVLKREFLKHLGALTDETLHSLDQCSDWNRLCIGISALQLFLQCNVVGPIAIVDGELYSRISQFVSRLSLANDRVGPTSSSRALLNLDGESAYPLVHFPQLLLLAKDSFYFSSSLGSVNWWRLRADWLHQLTLQEPVETLRSSVIDVLIPNFLASPFYTRLSTPHRVLFQLEAYHAFHYYSRSKDAARSLDAAASLAGVDLKVFGALGKRTKWQSEDKSQLVVTVEEKREGEEKRVRPTEDDEWWFLSDETTSKVEGEEESSPTRWWHSDAPTDIALDDDTLLDKIQFQNSDDDTEKSGWGPLEQAVVFCTMVDVGRRNSVRDLTEEELAAFRTALLGQNKKIFGIQAGCLFFRCRGEREKSRKVERALTQIEDLTNALKRFDADSSTPASTPGTGAGAGHRVFLVHALCLPFIWTMETLMADVMISLGLTSAALDVYLRLEAWTNVVDCYKKQGKRGAAEKLIREKLDLTKDPNILCILGDVTLDPSHYEEAWKLSNGSCARAMRTLGYDYLYKHRQEEAMDCFEKSLSVNALQIGVWYTLGCTALLADDNKRAEKAFLRCVHLDYDNFEAWTNLASAQVKLGFKDKACNTLQEALKCNYENWRIWENFLVVSADVGHPEDVMRAYHRLLDLKGEKFVDGEVLSVLVTLVIELRRTINEEDEPNLLAFQRLEKKCRELFGRVTSSVTDNSTIWKAYGILYLNLPPSSSAPPNRHDDGAVVATAAAADDRDRKLKGIQFLQRSFRCLTQKVGWELEVASVEETLREANVIVLLIFDEDAETDEDDDYIGVTVAQLSSLKMVVRMTIAKLEKKYGEAAPSADAKAEIEKLKMSLTSTEERIQKKKARGE